MSGSLMPVVNANSENICAKITSKLIMNYIKGQFDIALHTDLIPSHMFQVCEKQWEK